MVGDSMSTSVQWEDASIADMQLMLDCLNSEVDLFEKAIESVQVHAIPSDHGFARSVYLDTWLENQKSRFSEGRQPSGSAVFFIRGVIEALLSGSLTEREIKNSIVETCKDLGIRYTGRGTVAGLNLEVSTVCSMLNGLGILVADTELTSTLSANGPLTERRKAYLKSYLESDDNDSVEDLPFVESRLNSGVDVLNSGSDSISILDTAASSTNVNDQKDREFVANYSASLVDDELALVPAGEGSGLYAALSTMWRSKLEAYYDSVRVAVKAAQMKASAAEANHVAAVATSSVAEGIVSVANSTGDTPQLTVGEMFDPIPVDPPIGGLSDTIQDASVLIQSNGAADVAQHTHGKELNSSIVAVESQVLSVAATEAEVDGNSVPIDVDGEAGPEYSPASSSQLMFGPKVVKRAANQRAWKLAPASVLEPYTRPAEIISAWAEACYEEAAALEIEEALVRHIVGQLGRRFPSTPFREGTQYLLRSADPSVDIDALGSNGAVASAATAPSVSSKGIASTSLRDGAKLSASMLREKAKKSRVKAKRKLSIDSSYLVDDNSSRPAFKRSGSFSASTSTATTYGNAAGGPGSHLIHPSLAPLYAKKICPPLQIRDVPVFQGNMNMEGSIFANPLVYSSAQQTISATVIMPDLVIRTAAIPWKSVAAEFQPLDVEDVDNPLFALSFTPRDNKSNDASRSFRRQSSEEGGQSGFPMPSPRTPINQTPSSKKVKGSFGNSTSADDLTSNGTPRGEALQRSSSGASIASNQAKTVQRSNSVSSVGSDRPNSLGNGRDSKVPNVLAPSFREVPRISSPPPVARKRAIEWTSPWSSLTKLLSGAVDAPASASSSCNSCDDGAGSTDRVDDAADSDGGESEDISDEAITTRHERVLRTMRERWALMQKLKQEQKEQQMFASGHSRNTPGSGHSAGQSRNTPGSGHSAASSVGSGTGSHFFSPRRKSSGHSSKSSSNSRKRGRPPKMMRGDEYLNSPGESIGSEDPPNLPSSSSNAEVNSSGRITTSARSKESAVASADSDDADDGLDAEDDFEYHIVGLQFPSNGKQSTPLAKSPSSVSTDRRLSRRFSSRETPVAETKSGKKLTATITRRSSRLSPNPIRSSTSVGSMTSLTAGSVGSPGLNGAGNMRDEECSDLEEDRVIF